MTKILCAFTDGYGRRDADSFGSLDESDDRPRSLGRDEDAASPVVATAVKAAGEGVVAVLFQMNEGHPGSGAAPFAPSLPEGRSAVP